MFVQVLDHRFSDKPKGIDTLILITSFSGLVKIKSNPFHLLLFGEKEGKKKIKCSLNLRLC